MELRLQPKPKVEILPANQGIVSRKEFFVKKKYEEINKNFFGAHFMRKWKPKAELLYPSVPDETTIQYECDFNREVQNCFVEDYAEEVYLRTPPPCFVVIGKPGQSISKLSEEIAREYGSVLIQVDDIVNQVLKTNTETSKIIKRILRFGVSLTLNFILALLSFMAHSDEARHRGYVLCGLPSLPLSYDLSVDQQFNYLFTWENKPTVFINVLFDDEDLIKERTNLLCEIKGVESEKFIFYHSECENTKDEEETEEEDDDELISPEKETSYERNIDILPSRPWIQLPKNEESRVWSELELFNSIIKPAIQLIISRMDPQYFITVDSRVKNEFELVLARLNLLQVWKVPVAVPFILPKPEIDLSDSDTDFGKDERNTGNESEDDLDIKRAAEEPPETAFLTLFAKKTISPKFRWELSHYNYICPVSLREGEIIEGKSKFAVMFMKYIYFLKNEASMMKFIQNPRAFVLPIRPKPLCRFIILGLPFTGKTSLAEALAKEFSIPLIDLNVILNNDLQRKKNIYQEFCRQKAECREIIRLTSQAWQDWRMEEEQRINLIEDWILYIQSLLHRRIEEFYSAKDDIADGSEVKSSVESFTDIQLRPEESEENLGESEEKFEKNESLEVHGTSVSIKAVGSLGYRNTSAENQISPSTKIIQAMKHEDFDFNKKSLEVEANLFFSTLWRSFSHERQIYTHENISKVEEFGEFGEFSEYGEMEMEIKYEKKRKESITIDWCSLLPPQSLSSLLLNKKINTIQERRNSFQVLLKAASKAYWASSTLKTEFVKWRLPCFMDIPLCEIYLNNPILLLRYVPDWLKERPLIPDPVDPMHPSVVEAGRKAFLRAGVISVKQSQEEVGILLRDAIEKAEREGMRVTGEVISPGGWVVDNMSLDLEVWKKLACENVFSDHVYILNDSEPEYRRIINVWWEKCGKLVISEESLEENKKSLSVDYEEEVGENEDDSKPVEDNNVIKDDEEENVSDKGPNFLQFFTDNTDDNLQSDVDLDMIFSAIINDEVEIKQSTPTVLLDPFCQDLFKKVLGSLKKNISAGETLLAVQTLANPSFYSVNTFNFFSYHEMTLFSPNVPLGPQLAVITNKLLNKFKRKTSGTKEEPKCNESLMNSLEFFILLLTLPQRLEELKRWLTFLERDSAIKEIDVRYKSPQEVFLEIKNNLMAPFIKKPRELENFEIEEIKKSVSSASEHDLLAAEEKETVESKSEDEDVRIFGEAGSLCVVNLERNILLKGKLEFALRYYGKLYYFYNEDAKQQFLENPEKYAPYYSAIRCYPPFRIFIMGPVGSGKSALAELLGNQSSLMIIDYPKLLADSLVPYMAFTGEKLNFLTDQKLLLTENHNPAAKLAKENFMNAPYDKRQFLLENFFQSDFMEDKSFFENLLGKKPPVVVNDFPELRYLNEKVEEEKSEEEDLGSFKSEIGLPQTPYTSMKEIETIFYNYLTNTGDLNDYCIDKALKALWNREPYITKGFVIESFPFRINDMKSILKNNWVPDLVIEIELPKEEVIQRNIESLMETWDTKLKQEMVEEKLLEDTLISVQKTWVSFLREKIIEEKQREALENYKNQKKTRNEDQSEEDLDNFSRDQMGFENNFLGSEIDLKHPKLPDEIVEEIAKEVDNTLAEEFPAFVFNPVFETYDAGKARILEKLNEVYEIDSGEIEKLRTALLHLSVTYIQILGLKGLKEIQKTLFLQLNTLEKQTHRKGEFAFVMEMEMAEKLLRQGYYFLSKFGKWCPVQVYRKKNPIHMFRPLNAKGKVTPIAYRNYIYFVGGENEKVKFLEDPIKYTFNDPHLPNIPLRVAVIGPPKTGKSTLCKRLGTMFDLKVVTMGTALRFVLETTPETTLAKSIQSYLRRGCFLPLSLKVEALMVCLNSPSCVTQGFVFDGIPFDAALTQSLAERGKLPFVIISLVAEPDFGKTNRQNLDLKEFRLPYKNRTNLDNRYKDWNDTYKRFVQWNETMYNNLYEMNANLGVVDIFYKAYDIIKKSFFDILYYVENCVSNKVLPLRYLCISHNEYELRKSPFHNNCPVCWAELRRLISFFDPPDRSGLVQYLDRFYWVCPKHMEKFSTNPKLYFPPNTPKCPELLPKVISKTALEKNYSKMKIHGYERCPVTRVDFPKSLEWEGSRSCAAIYGDEIFLCKNKKMLERFLAQPWRYCEADTLFEVNRLYKSNAVKQLEPPKITSLPPIGFLEQTVADIIHDSLRILGALRPIYQNLNPTITGCIYLGLYLKTHNKTKKPTGLEKECLDIMTHKCKSFQLSPSVFAKRHELGPGNNDSDIMYRSDSFFEESNKSQSIFSTLSRNLSFDHCWLDLETQTEKNVWSAKFMSPKFTAMEMTSDSELIEIPEVPKNIVILKYQTYTLRSNPLPNISNCITFLYSCKKSLEIPDKFNYRTLYQSLPSFTSPYSPNLIFNPDKQFAMPIFTQNIPEFTSKPDLRKERFVSVTTLEKPEPKTPTPEDMHELFIPRFKLLDRLSAHNIPEVPKAIEKEPLTFNPHRDYAYMMLLSEFFQTTQVLRCYEWNDSQQQLEYSNRLDKNLGLTNVQVEFQFGPKKKHSMESMLSVDSYQTLFDAASSFAVHSVKESEHSLSQKPDQTSSLINFMEVLIFEKLDEVFSKLSLSNLSYDAYEISAASLASDKAFKRPTVIQEILPYPPLPWDIISRPYYAYSSIHSMFEMPLLDNIAHERHISLLDGITEPNERLRFVSYSTETKKAFSKHRKSSTNVKHSLSKPFYFVYDFFNLPWTSFLTYQHTWVYYTDFLEGFCDPEENSDLFICENSKKTET